MIQRGSKGLRGKRRGPLNRAAPKNIMTLALYNVDSISKPQASNRGSGIYFEFLFRRAHSRRRVERKYWSGDSLYSRTTCSNSVMVGVIGPIGSGLPQFGFPRRLAMKSAFLQMGVHYVFPASTSIYPLSIKILRTVPGMQQQHTARCDGWQKIPSDCHS